MATSAKLMTAEELLVIPRDDGRFELVEGELIELSPPPGIQHGFIAGKAFSVLDRFVTPRGLGIVLAAETGFQISSKPDTVRAPDAAFVAASRLPKGGLPTGYLRLAPDIAVEVVSPSDTASYVQQKVCTWLEAGCRLVWILYPESRSMAVFRSMKDSRILGPDDVLDAVPVLDGFSTSVSKLFE